MTDTAIAATSETSDWDLVRAVQRGDKEAFGVLWERYRRPLYRYLRFKLPDEETAQELLSDTCERALSRIATVSEQPGKTMSHWLFTVARNILFDNRKSYRVRQVVTVSPESCRELIDESAESQDPATIVGDNELASVLAKAQAQLATAAQRDVVDLRFWGGLTVEETAEALGIDTGAVKARQHRAVVGLRKILGREMLDTLQD